MTEEIKNIIRNRILPEDAGMLPHERGWLYAYEVVGWGFFDDLLEKSEQT